MIVLMDAYNFIHAIPELEGTLSLGLRASRDGLIRLCLSWNRERGDIELIYLVFDGSSEVYVEEAQKYPGLAILYSESGQEADDVIIDVLAQMGSRGKKIVVVSNDNYVINNSRAFGAEAVRAQDFYQRMKHKNLRAGKTQSFSGKLSEMPPHLADDITRAYKKHLGID